MKFFILLRSYIFLNLTLFLKKTVGNSNNSQRSMLYKLLYICYKIRFFGTGFSSIVTYYQFESLFTNCKNYTYFLTLVPWYLRNLPWVHADKVLHAELRDSWCCFGRLSGQRRRFPFNVER